MSDRTTIGVGMVGYAFMGRVHSQAWRSVGAFFDLPVAPRMAVLSGRSKERTEAAAAQLGWADIETDWRELVKRDDVQIVDICTPGDSHAEIAIAALQAGKHVICEKPLANTVAEAEAMVAAAAAATGKSMVAFNYRRVPAIALARRYVEEGRIGEIRHVRAQYLQDWIVDPEFPLVWRLQKDKAGSGALGDIGAHIVDAAQFVTGQNVVGVSALTETFIKERPLATESAGLGATGSSARGEVTVDDAALFIGRMSGGAVASFEATRFANGRKNAMRLEINGSLGSLAFDFEAMNELWFSANGGGFERILVTEPDHPYVGAWWPPGHGLGYEHTFTHEIKDFLEAVATGADPSPSFADGLRVQRVLEAVERSAADGSRYTNVED
ncbi:oxidoreductase [[Actinomadura] parvosata subsp. kistnae]|uniref:Dehydrogenase n=2 Tax=Nonomuraea TaxID=83681 RepID=A0A1V0AFN1_9ACTN|nr:MULTISPECIES: Gfo/Idh/MocA family oxidoreductase [unclassified Nonomuraea]AQZ68993.1 dehydrogenase [Nonomuraea sp. ATCC 55076]NJP90318.1 Gfo/Idh/MocA family oxidoreductase [Nonomuraea sp. FMUSA5-5]SPL92448.1 oxidoreductase [Actinomadura parvosata subsp. kistnae]